MNRYRVILWRIFGLMIALQLVCSSALKADSTDKWRLDIQVGYSNHHFSNISVSPNNGQVGEVKSFSYSSKDAILLAANLKRKIYSNISLLAGFDIYTIDYNFTFIRTLPNNMDTTTMNTKVRPILIYGGLGYTKSFSNWEIFSGFKYGVSTIAPAAEYVVRGEFTAEDYSSFKRMNTFSIPLSVSYLFSGKQSFGLAYTYSQFSDGKETPVIGSDMIALMRNFNSKSHFNSLGFVFSYRF